MSLRLVVDNGVVHDDGPRPGESNSDYARRRVRAVEANAATDDRIFTLTEWVRRAKMSPAEATMLFLRMSAEFTYCLTDAEISIDQKDAMLRVAAAATFDDAKARAEGEETENE